MRLGRIPDYLRLVKFSHSIFALPFALQSTWLAAGGMPRPWTLGWILVCAVAARTAAMGFNRLVDRRLDAANPRTAGRELPAGTLGTTEVATMVLLSSAVFVGGSFALNPLAGWLSFPVLAVLLGYSFAKRFTYWVHLILGVALGLAPLGAWIAVRGTLGGDLTPPLVLAATVVFWVAGFDLIYACQDAEHDRKAGLHSIPARFGKARALRVSRVFHGLTVLGLVFLGAHADLGFAWWLAVGMTTALLIYEQRLVAPDDLSRVDLAFFTLNGWVGVGLFLGLALDLYWRSPGPVGGILSGTP